jgi:hypothetical protein
MNCIVCFEYSDWVKPLEEEFKNNACEILSLPAPPHVDEDEDKAEEGATFAPGLVSPEALQGRWVNAKGQSINIKTKPNNPWKPALECDFGKGAKAELRDERGGKFSFPGVSCFGPKQRWELVTSESSPNKLVWALRKVAMESGADAVGSLIGEDKKAEEKRTTWERPHPLHHVNFELLRQQPGKYLVCERNLTRMERMAKLAALMAEVPCAPAAEAALADLVAEFAGRVDDEAQDKEFHLLGNYALDMHGSIRINYHGKEVDFHSYHDKEPVSWTQAGGKKVTARPKWGYCHGLSTKEGEGCHGVPAGEVRRCCPFDLDIFDELPGTNSTTRAQLEVLRTPEAVGERWGQLVKYHDALAARYAAEVAQSQANPPRSSMEMMVLPGRGMPKDPRVEIWAESPFSVLLNTPPRTLAAFTQSLLAEGRVGHLAIARHGVVGVELLNGMDSSPHDLGGGGDDDDDAPPIPRPLVQAATLAQPETVKALLSYGASKGVEEAVAAARVALEAAQAEVARLREPGQAGAAAATEAHFTEVAGGGGGGSRSSSSSSSSGGDGGGSGSAPEVEPRLRVGDSVVFVDGYRYVEGKSYWGWHLRRAKVLSEVDAAQALEGKCQEVLVVLLEHQATWAPLLSALRARCGIERGRGEIFWAIDEKKLAGFSTQTLIEQAYRAIDMEQDKQVFEVDEWQDAIEAAAAKAADRGSLLEKARRCVQHVKAFEDKNEGDEEVEEGALPAAPPVLERKRSSNVVDLPEREKVEANNNA